MRPNGVNLKNNMKKLIEFIKNISKDKKVVLNPDTLLFKEKVLDSMNILDLLGFIEKQLGRRLKDEEIVMSNFESARKIEEIFFKNHG